LQRYELFNKPGAANRWRCAERAVRPAPSAKAYWVLNGDNGGSLPYLSIAAPAFCEEIMQVSVNADNWYALYVRPRHEKSVKKILDYKGYATSLPLRKCYHTRSSGSEWESEKPLITGYVFVAFHHENPFQIVTTPGVITAVGFGAGACAIPYKEIEALERVAGTQLPVAACAYTHAGEIVELIRGPLKGLQGIVIRECGATHLVVGISMLQRSLSVQIENTWAVPSQN
jgi:transcription termination/antitermination protein NusG